MKKLLTKVTTILLALIMLFGVVGCGNNDPVNVNEDSDGKRIEIKATIAGYGVDWLDDIVAAFNETYKDEGYEAVITQKDTVINALNEIITPKKCTTDIYFQYTDLINKALDKSRSILKSDKALIADITDVFNSPAIGKDKKEQGEPIKDRYLGDIDRSFRYSGRLAGYDGLYGITWQGGTSGVYINKKVLADNGYTLNDILTTDDFIDVISKMAPEPIEENLINPNLMFPVAWSPTSAAGYWNEFWTELMCQYEGAESFKNFYECIPDEGDIVSNGYAVYEKRGILEALKVLETLLNKDWASPGTNSRDHVQMQAAVATGKSFMCVSGDWIYKELETDYSDYMEDVLPIKTPVISALGVKLGLCGTNHKEGDTCKHCNVKLRDIIKEIDDATYPDYKIASDNGVSEEKVARIREARGYFNYGYYSTSAVIPAFSDAIKGSKLFLRFLYSDDAMKLFRNKTYVDLPVKYVNEPEEDSREFVQLMYEKIFTGGNKFYTSNGVTPIRRIAGVSEFPKQGNMMSVSKGLAYSHSHAQKGQYSAQEVYEDNIEFVKKSWNDYLRDAGLD